MAQQHTAWTSIPQIPSEAIEQIAVNGSRYTYNREDMISWLEKLKQIVKNSDVVGFSIENIPDIYHVNDFLTYQHYSRPTGRSTIKLEFTYSNHKPRKLKRVRRWWNG